MTSGQTQVLNMDKFQQQIFLHIFSNKEGY